MSKEAFFFPDFPAPDEDNGFAVRPDTKNPAPDKGGINPQIRGVRRFRIRNGVPCRKQPQDTGRAWRTLRMAGEGCQLQNVDSASCITATFCI